MKKLLSQVFFASDCARGAVFALSLGMIGGVLWLSFFLMLSVCLGSIYPTVLCAFAVGAVLLTYYSLVLALTALARFVEILRRERRFRLLWHLLPAGACLAAGVCLFPPVKPIVLRHHDMVWSVLGGIGEKNGGFPELPSEYRTAVLLLALALTVAGWLFLAAMFAAAEKKKLRSAFGAATLTLWGVFVLWYLFTLGLALHEDGKVSVARRAVETRFGRPLTAAGLEALYRGNGTVDGEFWTRQNKLREALPRVKAERDKPEAQFCDFTLPDRPTRETLAWYDRYCRDHRAAIEKWESCFDREPPLPEKRFVHGKLWGVELPELGASRQFVRMERGRLIRALAAGDVDTAWEVFRRIGNVAAYLRKEPFLIGGLVWIAIEDQRLDCVEKLLDSRLLPDARLDELDADLAALEPALLRVYRQSMYAEAVLGYDTLTGMEEGLTDFTEWTDFRACAAALSQYRWIFPQVWYHAALDKKTLLEFFLAPDLAHPAEVTKNRLLIFCLMFVPGLDRVESRYRTLAARERGMRTLIRAEKYRRKHGEFPKTLSDLPEDPFTGKPLIYEVGPAKISETVWKKPVCSLADMATRTAEVVQVHCDPKRAAELKLVRRSDGSDDRTRAVIRR